MQVQAGKLRHRSRNLSFDQFLSMVCGWLGQKNCQSRHCGFYPGAFEHCTASTSCQHKCIRIRLRNSVRCTIILYSFTLFSIVYTHDCHFGKQINFELYIIPAPLGSDQSAPILRLEQVGKIGSNRRLLCCTKAPIGSKPKAFHGRISF